MKITKYGTTLHRLSQEDLELVRKARNNVREFMEYREYITPEMQQVWFDSIDNIDNFYYIIEYKNEKVGLINTKDIDRRGDNKFEESDSGIFMFDEKYFNTFIPVLASIILLEINFYLIKNEVVYAHVLKDNNKAILYNKSLGFELCETQEGIDNQKYKLTKENFEKKSKKIIKAASRISKGDDELKVVIEKSDFDKGFGYQIEKLLIDDGLSGNTMENGDKVYRQI